MATFDPWIARLKSLWQTLTPPQRIGVATVVVAGFVAAAYFVIAPTAIAYAPLYRDLAAGDLREIQQVLGKDGVPFRQEERTGTIEVPSEQIEKVRMRLASEGLPRQGGPGFEILDSPSIGATEFDQKIAMQRALEGELARTIRGLDSVEAVRVHLVLAAHEMFRSEESPASASVVLRLHAGRGLSAAQVGGIVHLVSSAVRGLEPNQVTVIDQHGSLLTPPGGRGDGAEAGSNLADGRRTIESDLERRIESLVVPIVGAGHVVARVGVELDTTRRETTETRFDPDTTAIRSESRTEEKQSQTSAAPGTASVTANVPGGQGAPATAPSGRSSQQSTVNYEISKVEKRSVELGGAVKRVTAAVLVDGTYGEGKDGQPGEYTPIPADALTRIEGLVREAVSFNEKRGDSVRIENVRFQVPEVLKAETAGRDWMATGLALLRAAAPALGIALLYFTVLRPLLRSIPMPVRPAFSTTVEVGAAGGSGLAESAAVALAEHALPADPMPITTRMRGEIETAARQDPKRVAMLIQTLVQED